MTLLVRIASEKLTGDVRFVVVGDVKAVAHSLTFIYDFSMYSVLACVRCLVSLLSGQHGLLPSSILHQRREYQVPSLRTGQRGMQWVYLSVSPCWSTRSALLRLHRANSGDTTLRKGQNKEDKLNG